nr:hypothetical protein [uncultured Hyphomonas sp.]
MAFFLTDSSQDRVNAKFFPHWGKKYGILVENRVKTLSNWARHARRTALCTRQQTQ